MYVCVCIYLFFYRFFSTMTYYKILSMRYLWNSRLKIWHCHCSSVGCCCGSCSIPGLRTFTCHGHSLPPKDIEYSSLCYSRSLLLFLLAFFFFFSYVICSSLDRDQLSHCCNLYGSWPDPQPTEWGLGWNLRPSTPEMLLILLHHSGNSRSLLISILYTVVCVC